MKVTNENVWYCNATNNNLLLEIFLFKFILISFPDNLACHIWCLLTLLVFTWLTLFDFLVCFLFSAFWHMPFSLILRNWFRHLTFILTFLSSHPTTLPEIRVKIPLHRLWMENGIAPDRTMVAEYLQIRHHDIADLIDSRLLREPFTALSEWLVCCRLHYAEYMFGKAAPFMASRAAYE